MHTHIHKSMQGENSQSFCVVRKFVWWTLFFCSYSRLPLWNRCEIAKSRPTAINYWNVVRCWSKRISNSLAQMMNALCTFEIIIHRKRVCVCEKETETSAQWIFVSFQWIFISTASIFHFVLSSFQRNFIVSLSEQSNKLRAKLAFNNEFAYKTCVCGTPSKIDTLNY